MHAGGTMPRYARSMKKRYGALLGALLLASACGHSASSASSATAASGSLEGVKYRVPVYTSNLTSPPTKGLAPGIYQFQTADSVLTVVAWYKAHLPSNMGGSWVSSDPSGAAANVDWSYVHTQGAGDDFSLDVEHSRSNGPAYAPGTKTIVEVVDR